MTMGMSLANSVQPLPLSKLLPSYLVQTWLEALGIELVGRWYPGHSDVLSLPFAAAQSSVPSQYTATLACLISLVYDRCRPADLPSQGKKALAASPTAEDGEAVTPQAKEPERADQLSPSDHSLPTGLAAIADAAEHASPFSSEHKVF